jgi:glycosyltransferase involved in cell wall biosynthesis
MRVLLWYWGRRGGGAQYALSLGRELAQRGAVFSLSRQNALIGAFRTIAAPRQEVSTYNGAAGFAAGFARLPGLTRGLIRFAREQRADVVFSAMAHPWTPFIAPSLTRAGLVFIPAIHDAVPHPGDPAILFDWRLRRELAAARAAVVFSQAVAAAVRARRPDLPLISLSLGAHLPNGIVDAAKTTDFLFFGRFRRYKGLDLLRDAWPAVRAAWPDATLRVVGEGDAEACAPGLAALAGVALESRWVADAAMAPLVASARALVLPYREASQSGVLPIALATGVPAIATDVGGLREQLAGGGLVIPADPAALAAAMLRLREPTEYARLAAEARRAGAALADWGAMADRLLDSISGVLRSSAPGRPIR